MIREGYVGKFTLVFGKELIMHTLMVNVFLFQHTPGLDTSNMSLLGSVLSHDGYLVGHLPIRIGFPVIAATLKGPIPDGLLIECFFLIMSVLMMDLY